MPSSNLDSPRRPKFLPHPTIPQHREFPGGLSFSRRGGGATAALDGYLRADLGSRELGIHHED